MLGLGPRIIAPLALKAAAVDVTGAAYDGVAHDLVVSLSDGRAVHVPVPVGLEVPPGSLQVTYDSGTARLVVTLSDGQVFTAPVPSAAIPPPAAPTAWTLADNIDLTDPRLRMDGRVVA